MINKIKIKRRNYFIKKDFQGKLILGLFLFVVGSIITFVIILSMFSSDSMTISYRDSNLELGQTPVMLLKYALAANWVFIIFGGSLLVLAALMISHRIAGPQFHFEETIKKMINGNLNHTIHLRKHDEGETLAGQINTLNKQLSEKIGNIDQHSRSIDELINLLDKEKINTSIIDMEELMVKCHSIRKHNNAIREITTSFTLAND